MQLEFEHVRVELVNYERRPPLGEVQRCRPAAVYPLRQRRAPELLRDEYLVRSVGL